MSYAAVHSRSYGLVSRKGASVTFSKEDLTYTASTDSSTSSTSTVTGVAVQDRAGKTFRADSLEQAKGLVIYFVPTTLGDEPEEGSTCSWGGVAYSVASVKSVAPDGDVIGSYVELK